MTLPARSLSLVFASLFALASSLSLGCGGSDDDTSGSTGAAGAAGALKLTCDLSKFPGVPAGAVREPTAAEFAKYVKSYTGGVYDDATMAMTNGPAELKADGQLVMLSKTYAPTSYCFDTTIGAVDYGNTLYVHFEGGKADLWEKNGMYAGSFSKNP